MNVYSGYKASFLYAGTFPDHLKPNEYLKKLNLILKDDGRLRMLMKTLVGTSCTCKKAEDIVVSQFMVYRHNMI